jgi:hypothetical protein
VQNLSVVEVQVTITYVDHTGSTVKAIVERIPAGSSRLHYQPNDGLPAGFHGSVRVVASFDFDFPDVDGPPIVGLANQLAVGQGGGDWLMTYEGINVAP